MTWSGSGQRSFIFTAGCIKVPVSKPVFFTIFSASFPSAGWSLASQGIGRSQMKKPRGTTWPFSKRDLTKAASQLVLCRSGVVLLCQKQCSRPSHWVINTLHQFMCFLHELYFTFISHLFFRLDIDGFSFAAKMHLALWKTFPAQVPAQVTYRICERSDHGGNSDHTLLQLLRGRKADTAGYWEAAHVKPLPAWPLCWQQAWQEPPCRREWDQSLWAGQNNLSCPQDHSPAPCLWADPPPHTQHQGQQEHILQVTCNVLWPQNVPSLCPDLATPSLGPSWPRAEHLALAPRPPLLPGFPWANPAPPKARAAGSSGVSCRRKASGEMQTEGCWKHRDILLHLNK